MLRRRRGESAPRLVEAPVRDRLRELADAEARRVAARDRIEAERAEVRRELDALTERVALAYLGDGDPDAVRRERAELRGRLVELDGALSENSRTGGVFQHMLAEARQTVADEREAAAKRRWLEDLAARDESARGLAERLRAADVAAAELEAARMEEAASRRAYEKAVSDAGHKIPPLPDSADEPEWAEGVEGLARVIIRGPLRPVAEKRERNQRAAAEREVQRRELVSWIERHGTRRDLARLKPEERVCVERLWDEEHTRQRGQRQLGGD